MQPNPWVPGFIPPGQVNPGGTAGAGLNPGNYLRLRPCPNWRGGPDENGQVPSGAESYRDYVVRLQRWIMTGQRIGVANGILSSELAEALPEGPKKLLRGIPNE